MSVAKREKERGRERDELAKEKLIRPKVQLISVAVSPGIEY